MHGGSMAPYTIGNYTITPQSIPDVLLIEPAVRSDERGEFLELYKLSTLGRELGFTEDHLAQINISWSNKGVLRGLHYQGDRPQGKLVTVISGEVHDVAVDIRESSPTFGHSVGVVLSRDNHAMLWIPPGFAHGLLSLENDSAFAYLISDHEYTPGDEYGLRWDDHALAITWPLHKLTSTPSIHPRDASWPHLTGKAADLAASLRPAH